MLKKQRIKVSAHKNTTMISKYHVKYPMSAIAKYHIIYSWAFGFGCRQSKLHDSEDIQAGLPLKHNRKSQKIISKTGQSINPAKALRLVFQATTKHSRIIAVAMAIQRLHKAINEDSPTTVVLVILNVFETLHLSSSLAIPPSHSHGIHPRPLSGCSQFFILSEKHDPNMKSSYMLFHQIPSHIIVIWSWKSPCFSILPCCLFISDMLFAWHR